MTALALNTKEAMKALKVKTYEQFNAIREKYKIEPLWRGGEGNVYSRAAIEKIFNPVDNQSDPFYDHVDG